MLTVRSKKAYIKPLIEKVRDIDFRLLIKTPGDKQIVCRQCSACHGCR